MAGSTPQMRRGRGDQYAWRNGIRRVFGGRTLVFYSAMVDVRRPQTKTAAVRPERAPPCRPRKRTAYGRPGGRPLPSRDLAVVPVEMRHAVAISSSFTVTTSSTKARQDREGDLSTWSPIPPPRLSAQAFDLLHLGPAGRPRRLSIIAAPRSIEMPTIADRRVRRLSVPPRCRKSARPAESGTRAEVASAGRSSKHPSRPSVPWPATDRRIRRTAGTRDRSPVLRDEGMGPPRTPGPGCGPRCDTVASRPGLQRGALVDPAPRSGGGRRSPGPPPPRGKKATPRRPGLRWATAPAVIAGRHGDHAAFPFSVPSTAPGGWWRRAA